MRKYIYFLIILLVIVLMISLYGIVNTMVSLKYETENPGDCISLTSGINLCRTLNILKFISGFCVIAVIALGYYLLFQKSKTSH